MTAQDDDTGTLWPTRTTLRDFLTAERRANPRDPRTVLVLTLLRLTQVAMGSRTRPRLAGKIASAAYRALTELVLGVELRPKTVVGPGLRIYHGFGLVVNDHVVGCFRYDEIVNGYEAIARLPNL